MNIDLQDLDIKIEDDYDPRVKGREDVLAKPKKGQVNHRKLFRCI